MAKLKNKRTRLDAIGESLSELHGELEMRRRETIDIFQY